jgi:hypothetical protein
MKKTVQAHRATDSISDQLQFQHGVETDFRAIAVTARTRPETFATPQYRGEIIKELVARIDVYVERVPDASKEAGVELYWEPPEVIDVGGEYTLIRFSEGNSES